MVREVVAPTRPPHHEVVQIGRRGVVEAGEFGVEVQLDVAGRAVALLGDDHFDDVVVNAALVSS
jgi:hypothetical protein